MQRDAQRARSSSRRRAARATSASRAGRSASAVGARSPRASVDAVHRRASAGRGSTSSNGLPAARRSRSAASAARRRLPTRRLDAPAASWCVQDAAVGRVVVDDEHAASVPAPARRRRRRPRRRRLLEARREPERRLPSPDLLSTPISPPISSTSCCEIARPRPVPPYCRVVEPSACVNASNRAVCTRLGRCRCRCRAPRTRTTRVVRRLRSRATRDDDLAALGELDGVADQVDQHLAQRGPDRRAAPSARRDRRARPARGPCCVRRARPAGRRRPRSRAAGRSRASRARSLPASIFEKSRMSLMIVEQRVGAVCDRLGVLALLGVRGRCRAAARSCR